MPGIGVAGVVHQEAMEAAFTELQLLAENQQTVDRAHFLTSIARRIAVARAVHGPGRMPVELDERLFTAEREFVNGARRELGLVDISGTPPVQELVDIDTALRAAYERGTQGRATDALRRHNNRQATRRFGSPLDGSDRS